MPGPYGVVSTGFAAKPEADIRSDIEARLKTTFGNGIDLSVESVFGQLVGIFSERLADVWQLGQAIYSNSFPDGASQTGLDLLCSLTGTARKAATSSRVQVLLSGTPGTLITAGKILSVTGVGTRFQLAANATIGVGGSVTAEFVAVTTGPTVAPAGTLTTIETPVAGWASALNALDQFYLGTNIETDAELRLRREQSLRALGGGSNDAIQAALFEVLNVSDAFVFANETDSTDVNGLPPHSFECVVNGGADAEIAAKIFAVKPSAAATHGTTSTSVNDSVGTAHVIKFSRPTTLNVYVTVDVTASRALAPSNITTLIAEAIVSFGDLHYNVGAPVIAAALIPAIFSSTVGIYDVPSVKIGTAPSPTASTTINTSNRQIADLDTSRVVVNLTLV